MSVDISVCICTFKRAELLAELLSALERQNVETPAFEVIVVDNDAQCSAKGVIDAARSREQLKVTYISEPQQNISLARNRAVAAAQGTWLALIDDDEEPSWNWLLKMHEAAQRYSAQVVLGPVIPRFPESAPEWMIKGRFYERPRHATGAIVPYMDVRTSNLFLLRAAIESVEGPFDLAFGLSGGEDVMLLETLRSRGQKMIWCDEATVEETVPKERLRASWLLRRSYRGAQSYLQVHRALGRTPGNRLWRTIDIFCRACILAVASAVVALLSLPLGRAYSFFWLRKAVAQFGKLSAIVGRRYEEYA